ncbi:MAG: hypothetical protein Q8N03_14175 [Ignavibacteria bacterium]|nr:hypothetical protein [Ignavibacteria bacterium]
MNKNITLWILALIITLASAYYQRLTGPTYPISNRINIDGKLITYKLDRTHGGKNDHKISMDVEDQTIEGQLLWKRYKTKDEWTYVKMQKDGSFLTSYLPHQPPAGKLMYKIIFSSNGKNYPLNNNHPVVIRFKGDVPKGILIPHIIFIFLAMLFSTRTGLQIFWDSFNLKKYTVWTVVILTFGGMIFGPLTQFYAFGALWTGFPFGYDLTDNKTLIALVGWLIALFAVFKLVRPKWWVFGAAVLMLIIFLIPHSVLGSELDYEKLDKEKSKSNVSALIYTNNK